MAVPWDTRGVCFGKQPADWTRPYLPSSSPFRPLLRFPAHGETYEAAPGVALRDMLSTICFPFNA